jgi:uncharacterized protein YecE (DUF72 family)
VTVLPHTSPGPDPTRIGIAGWAIPAAYRLTSSLPRSHLEQYAQYFNAVEINSSFYRPHRLETYQRWRSSVPPGFRFAVKIPRSITHDAQLAGCADELAGFLQNVSGLDEKLAVLLVQLPPGFAFEQAPALQFLRLLTQRAAAKIVWEARNPSWFSGAVDDLFARFDIARVRAHPVPALCAAPEPGNADFTYLRLHGSPRMYYSSYSQEFLGGLKNLVHF